MEEYIGRAAQSYVNYLNKDNGVYTTSHLVMIKLLAPLDDDQKEQFHERVTELLRPKTSEE